MNVIADNRGAAHRGDARQWFAVQWVLANAAGVAASMAITKAIGPIGFACLGIIPGVLQWLLLRREVPGLGWWAAMSSAGLALGFFLAMLPMNMAGVDGPQVAPLFTLGFGLMGAVPGFLQWLLLRRRVPRSGWWVLASGVGMAGCGMAYLGLTRGSDVRIAWGGAAGGAVYAAVTGIVLAWLLRSYRRGDGSTAVTAV